MRLSDYFDSLTGENIGARNLKRDEDGNLTITVDSSMLPGVNVDTYQCFSGDSWVENELDYPSTEGIPEWLEIGRASCRERALAKVVSGSVITNEFGKCPECT